MPTAAEVFPANDVVRIEVASVRDDGLTNAEVHARLDLEARRRYTRCAHPRAAHGARARVLAFPHDKIVRAVARDARRIADRPGVAQKDAGRIEHVTIGLDARAVDGAAAIAMVFPDHEVVGPVRRRGRAPLRTVRNDDRKRPGLEARAVRVRADAEDVVATPRPVVRPNHECAIAS